MSVDTKTLKNYIKILTDNYQLKFTDATKNTHISNAIDVISKENDKGNPILISEILGEYRPSQLLPNTIGSFLFGCLQQNYGDVPIECSPLCAYGIKIDEELEVKRCQNQIYVQYSDEINSRFFKLNDNESRLAYLFVHINFMGLTHNEKLFFKNNGVYKLHILLTHNSKHHTVVKMRDLEDIPTIEEYEGVNYMTSDNYSVANSIDNNDADNAYLYIILSVAVIIIIAAAYSRN